MQNLLKIIFSILLIFIIINLGACQIGTGGPTNLGDNNQEPSPGLVQPLDYAGPDLYDNLALSPDGPYSLSHINRAISIYDPDKQYVSTYLDKFAITKRDKVELRTKNNYEWDSQVLRELRQGERLSVISELGSWYRVSYVDSASSEEIEAWVNRENLWIEDLHRPAAIKLRDSSQTDLHSPSLSLAVLSNNELAINFTGYDDNLKLDLIDRPNGVYSLVWTQAQDDSSLLSFHNIYSNLNHPYISLVRVWDQQVDFYSDNWQDASLVEVGPQSWHLYFPALVQEIDYISLDKEGDIRDRLALTTTGHPVFDYKYDQETLTVDFANEVGLDLTSQLTSLLAVDKNYLSEIHLDGQVLTVKSQVPVNWRVVEGNNQIILEASPLGLAGKLIAIDPGHGGEETGTYGRVTQVWEKDFNMEMSLAIAAELEEAGARVFLTRTDDSLVYPLGEYDDFQQTRELLARVDLAKVADADIFISVHADNYPADRRINGTSAHYHSKTLHSRDSYRLAETLGLAVADSISTRWQGTFDNDFAVIKYNPYPAALVEFAFLSNQADELKILDADNQKIMAQNLRKALENYFNW